MDYYELDETPEDYTRGLAPLITYFSKLIAKFREKNMSAKNLMILAKAKCLLENMQKLDYKGEVRIEAGQENKGGGSNFFVCIIESDDVRLGQEGVERFDDGQTEGVSDQMYCLTDGDEYMDAIEKVKDWIQGFEELSNQGTEFKAFDEVDTIHELFIEEEEEDEYDEEDEDE